MRGFKAKVEEEQRVQRIKEIARHIYWGATEQAQKKTESVYKYTIPLERQFMSKRVLKAPIKLVAQQTPREEQFMNQQVLYQNSTTVNAPCEFHTKNMPDILQELR
jgi:hypothetical protein